MVQETKPGKNFKTIPCNLSINMDFRAVFFEDSLPVNGYESPIVTKLFATRLVHEFLFGYNQPAIVEIQGRKLQEAL